VGVKAVAFLWDSDGGWRNNDTGEWRQQVFFSALTWMLEWTAAGVWKSVPFYHKDSLSKQR